MNIQTNSNEVNIIHIFQIIIKHKVIFIFNALIFISIGALYNNSSQKILIHEITITSNPFHSSGNYNKLLALENYFNFKKDDNGQKYQITEKNDPTSWMNKHFSAYIDSLRHSPNKLKINPDNNSLRYTIQLTENYHPPQEIENTLKEYDNLYIKNIINNYKVYILNQISLLDNDLEYKAGKHTIQLLDQLSLSPNNHIYEVVSQTKIQQESIANKDLIILLSILFSFIFSGLLIFFKNAYIKINSNTQN